MKDKMEMKLCFCYNYLSCFFPNVHSDIHCVKISYTHMHVHANIHMCKHTHVHTYRDMPTCIHIVILYIMVLLHWT